MTNFLIKAYVTVLGLGKIPAAPGTWGTIGGLILWYLIKGIGFYYYLSVVIVLIIVSSLLSGIAEKIYGIKDPQCIVVDEVCGYMVAMIGINANIWWGIAGFVLFRLFDILKPQPVKIFETLPDGWGIVADDVMAGIYAAIILNISIAVIV